MTGRTLGTAEPKAGASLAERAYVTLRDQLILLEIPPGAPISERELMKQLRMGSTPVREAIKRLALENLIDVFPRRGTFASDIRITDLAAISEVRIQLEGYAARLAAERLTPDGRAALDTLLEELEATTGAASRDLISLDARIHRFIYGCARNPYLAGTLDRHLSLSLRIWCLVLDQLPDLLGRIGEHRELLRAIRAGDADRAREIAAAHVAIFEREIRKFL